LARASLVDIWSDNELRGGDRWQDEITAALDAAGIAVLLISQHFLASTFVRDEELPRILQRHSDGRLTILPVFLSPSTVTSDAFVYRDASMREHSVALAKFQGFGSPDSTLSELPLAERRRAFVNLHDRIRELAAAAADRERPQKLDGREAASSIIAPQRPRVAHIPLSRNRDFTGHEADLRELHRVIGDAGVAGAPIALVGPAGIGKTELALEYTYRRASEYDVVWWIRSKDEHTRIADVRALGAALGIDTGVEPSHVVAVVLDWLGRHSDWLVVFDDTEHANDVRHLLPANPGGGILITSRNPAWGRMAHTHLVGAWTEDEAVSYLLRRTGLEDRDSAAMIARTMGYLPLALKHAAAVVEETGGKFADYLALLGEPGRTTGVPSPTDETLGTMWDITFEGLRASNAAALELFSLLAFVPAEGVSRALLVQQAGGLPAAVRDVVQDPVTLDSALGTLRRFSLVDATSDTLSVHRLAQAAVQARLDESTYRLLASAAKALHPVRPSQPATPRGVGGSTHTGARPTRPHAGVAALSPRHLWPSAQIPYRLSKDLTDYNVAAIQRAIAHVQERTVLRFRLLTEGADGQVANFITFISGPGDWSHVGMMEGGQQVSVSKDSSVGNILHSIGHSVGLWHESSRTDRDQYVTINWANIEPAFQHNFTEKTSGDENVRPYDYRSIMHYPRHAYSSNGEPTIVPKNDVEIGQRFELSAGDIRLINALYQTDLPPTDRSTSLS